MKRITIKEIARLAGVSASTVSNAINNKPGINPETCRRVLDIVEKLNFIPSQSSRSLVLKKTSNIAILFNTNSQPLDHLFHSDLNRSILDKCTKSGYNLVFTSFQFSKNETPVLPQIIRSYGVDGIITYGYMPLSLIADLNSLGIPFLLLDSHESEAEAISISVDYKLAAVMAMNYLVERGHQKIAYIGSNFPPQYSQQTFEGYRSVMEEHKYQIPMSWIQMHLKDIDNEDSAVKQMSEILNSGSIPTAVFCAADVFAIGAIRCIKEYGLNVPADISIISIDDILISRYIDPALTTVRVDRNALAALGWKQLISSIESDCVNNDKLVYTDFTLIERDSVRRI
jgi:DNA-binding LacI/PurR family transcriptional regulator